MRFTTNNLLLALGGISGTLAEYFKLLSQFKPDFFQWKYLRPKGIWYLLKVFKKFTL